MQRKKVIGSDCTEGALCRMLHSASLQLLYFAFFNARNAIKLHIIMLFKCQ